MRRLSRPSANSNIFTSTVAARTSSSKASTLSNLCSPRLTASQTPVHAYVIAYLHLQLLLEPRSSQHLLYHCATCTYTMKSTPARAKPAVLRVLSSLHLHTPIATVKVLETSGAQLPQHHLRTCIANVNLRGLLSELSGPSTCVGRRFVSA